MQFRCISDSAAACDGGSLALLLVRIDGGRASLVLDRSIKSRGTPAFGTVSMDGERADDCDVTSDEDMLLFQWGTHDWGQGAKFEIDVVRQVVLPDEFDDDAIWQLHLTYRYPVTDRLRLLGAGDQWCAAPSDLTDFERYIRALPVNAAVAGRVDADVEILFECAG